MQRHRQGLPSPADPQGIEELAAERVVVKDAVDISPPGQAIFTGGTGQTFTGFSRTAGDDKGIRIAAIPLGPAHVDFIARQALRFQDGSGKRQVAAVSRHLRRQFMRYEGRRHTQEVQAFDAAQWGLGLIRVADSLAHHLIAAADADDGLPLADEML